MHYKYYYPGLHDALRERGETQDALAKALGQSRTAVSLKINGIRGWSQRDIDKIIKYFGKTYEELFRTPETEADKNDKIIKQLCKQFKCKPESILDIVLDDTAKKEGD